MNERDQQENSSIGPSSYGTLTNNNRPSNSPHEDSTTTNTQRKYNDSPLTTRSLFAANQQRKTSISFDKIKQLTLALSLPSGEDDIAPVENSSDNIEQKSSDGTYDFLNNNNNNNNNNEQQLNDNDDANYKMLSSSSSAEEASSDPYVIHRQQNEASESHHHNSSSSLLNTPMREKHTITFTKLDQSATKLAIGPDNEQDSGLESEFCPIECLAQNFKFDLNSQYNGNMDLSRNVDINAKGYNELHEQYKQRDYNLKGDMEDINSDNKGLSSLRKPNLSNNTRSIEESYMAKNRLFKNASSSTGSFNRNTMGHNLSYNSARTSKLDDTNAKQSPTGRYYSMNPDLNRFRVPLDAEVGPSYDEHNNNNSNFSPRPLSDSTYSLNVSTSSPQRMRHRYMIRSDGVLEDTDRNLGIKLTQTQNNQKVTVTMITHSNLIKQDNKPMEEQLCQDLQIDSSMIGLPEHTIRDMNIDPRNQGDHDGVYKANRLTNYGVYSSGQRRAPNQEHDDYEKNQRRLPQAEWSNVPRTVSRASSNYEGSSASRARSRSPQSECSYNRSQRTVINPNTGITHDNKLVGDDLVDEEACNQCNYPQMTSTNFYGHQDGETYASPTKSSFPTRSYESSSKSDCVTPPTTDAYKIGTSYKRMADEQQDRAALLASCDDYSTITTNYSINNQSMQVMTKLSSPISNRVHLRSGPAMNPERYLEAASDPYCNSNSSSSSMNNNSRVPIRRLSSCGAADVLQIDVEDGRSDLMCSDMIDHGGGDIEIVIGNVGVNQSAARSRSKNPFLTNDYVTPPASSTLDASCYMGDATQRVSTYMEPRRSKFNQAQQPQRQHQYEKQRAQNHQNQSLYHHERRQLEKMAMQQNESLSENVPDRRSNNLVTKRYHIDANDDDQIPQPTGAGFANEIGSSSQQRIDYEFSDEIGSASIGNSINASNTMMYEQQQRKHAQPTLDQPQDYRDNNSINKNKEAEAKDSICSNDSNLSRQSTKPTTISPNATVESSKKKNNTNVAKPECPEKAPVETIQMKPIKLRNLINGNQTVDTLHQTSRKAVGCTYLNCTGSIVNPEPVKHQVRSGEEILEQAKQFLNQYYTSIKRLNSPAHQARIEEIKEQIKLTKTYYLKETELIFGAKLAWRNAPRCIGRIQWSKLQVFDARFTTTTHEMFEALCNHIRYATNRGSLRSAITIFPQRVKSTKYDYRVWNSQLIGYAGYRQPATKQDEADAEASGTASGPTSGGGGGCRPTTAGNGVPVGGSGGGGALTANRGSGAGVGGAGEMGPTKIVGDPANADFTEMCQKLGWRGKGTQFDVLPLVLSANGSPPQFFPLPEDLVLRVKLHHPKYDWFKELGLEWYALPAVSSMMLDVGGLQFPAAPFSGWYMVTEIGTRDLGDASRYNALEPVAQRLNLDTTTNASLWRDQALVVLNMAVLDSFQRAGVTIVDHHTASETFMTHLANEQRLRGGCPADWVWIVPPTSGSTTQVYHQEMVNYHLLPNYEYLEPAWKSFDWSRLDTEAAAGAGAQNGVTGRMGASPLTPSRLLGGCGLTPRKLRFKEIARAVKFTSKLFGKALSRRIKATILYATETGKSERYANKLAQIFSHAFNVHLMCMNDYDMTCLEHEALLLIVTSTFGNGDPPENGETFARQLHAIKLTGDTTPDMDACVNLVSTTTFTRVLSQSVEDPVQQSVCPLSNVRFSVFSLGSTAYPNFCAFGRYVDQTLGELGAERILKCQCGDELCGQERAFAEWSKQVFRTACEVFCISDSFVTINERTSKWNPKDVRFIPISSDAGLAANVQQDLINMTNKKIITFRLRHRRDLHPYYPGPGALQTICVDLETSDGLALQFEPGDHVAIYPTNNVQLVTGILDHMRRHQAQLDTDIVYKILVRREDLDITPAAGSSSTTGGNTSGGGGGGGGNSISGSPSTSKTNSTNGLSAGGCAGAGAPASPSNYSANDGNHSGHEADSTNPCHLHRLARLEATPDPGHKSNGANGSGRDLPDIGNALTNLSIVDNNSYQDNNDKQDGASARPDASGLSNGNQQHQQDDDEWILHDRLPVTSIREALLRFLDITTPPSQEYLSILAQFTDDATEKKRLQQLATNSALYEEWKHEHCPNLLHVLHQFRSVAFKPALLTQLPLIQPRFYSISSSCTMSDSRMSLTVGIIRWTTRSGHNREGVCSNYLNRADESETIYGYIRSAPSFHMPQDTSLPMILIGPGTGIAPFRSFWQYRYSKMAQQKQQQQQQQQQQSGSIDLYFGCRNHDARLYKEELEDMVSANVITNLEVAYSRLATIPKHYVQDRLRDNQERVRDLILNRGAHVYVCGDVAMAEGVHKQLQNIIGGAKNGDGSEPQSDEFLLSLREQNRYHEDIFGAKPSS